MTSYISSLFSRDPGANFAYELGNLILDDSDRFLWSIYKGKKKNSNESATIFAIDIKQRSESEVDLAKQTLKRLKMLRHPNVITFLDSLETDKVIYLVTEQCLPLEIYLQETKLKGKQKELAAAWGFYQIANAINFLCMEAKLIHNNINSTSVFVTASGQWKLCGFEYVIVSAGSNSSYPPAKPHGLEKYSPPEKSGKVSQSEPWAIDMWGMACLIWEVFNGSLPNQASLKSPKQIPKSLHSVYAQLIAGNPSRRPAPDDFVKECRKAPNGFFRNKFVDTLLFLEEFQLKEQREKNQFFASLKDHLDLFPEDVAKNKILPRLIEAYQYGDAGSSVLTPLFRLAKLLSEAEYQEKIVPCIVKLFSSPDRATRVKLLEKIEDFVEHLGPPVVNDKIFPSLKSGFLDTNPAVRESTVKAMISLAPKLNYQNLNVELMGHFARLQGKDDQPGIRTNTTICLGKVSSYIHPSNRQKILISAFTRSMKDPFPPARVAGVLALSATQQYYQLAEIAGRILPALAGLTMDPEKNVRDSAFKSIRGFLEKLEKASENPELIPELEAGVQAGSGSGILSAEKVPQWASWAFSAISGKFYKAPPQPSGEKARQEVEVTGGTLRHNLEDKETIENGRKNEFSEKITESSSGWDDDDDDGVWGDLDSESRSASSERREQKVEPRMKFGKPDEKAVSWDEDDDEDDKPWSGWDDVEPTETKIPSGSGTSGLKLGASTKKAPASTNNDDFLNDLLGGPASGSAKPASKPITAKTGSTALDTKNRNAELSASTAFGPTGPIRTTLDKKKPTANQRSGGEIKGSDGWDFEADDQWGEGGGTKSDQWGSEEGGWGDDFDSGWGSNDFGTTKTAQHRKPQKTVQERRAEIEQKRQAKAASGMIRLGAKKMAKD